MLTCATFILLVSGCVEPNADRQMSFWWCGWSDRASAKSWVRKECCEPSSKRMFVSASLALEGCVSVGGERVSRNCVIWAMVVNRDSLISSALQMSPTSLSSSWISFTIWESKSEMISSFRCNWRRRSVRMGVLHCVLLYLWCSMVSLAFVRRFLRRIRNPFRELWSRFEVLHPYLLKCTTTNESRKKLLAFAFDNKYYLDVICTLICSYHAWYFMLPLWL